MARRAIRTDRLIAVLGVVSMLSGCGAKGDLFLPPHDTQQTEEK